MRKVSSDKTNTPKKSTKPKKGASAGTEMVQQSLSKMACFTKGKRG